mgnify:CR=1 FL=1
MPIAQSDDGVKPKPLRRRGEARREAILHAAMDVFLQKGFEAASVSEIMDRAGGSRSLLYEQFGGKTGLFEAMIRERCAELMAPLGDLFEPDAGVRPTLTALGRGFVDTLARPDLIALQRIAVAEGPRHPIVGEIYFDVGHEVAYDRLVQYLRTLAPTGVDSGRLRRAAVMFFAMVQGDATERLLVGSASPTPSAEIDAYIAAAVDWLIAWIGIHGHHAA